MNIPAVIVRMALAAGVSAAIIAMLLHLFGSGIDDATRPTLLQLLGNTIVYGVVLYAVLNLLGLYLRSLRYRILIIAAAEQQVPSLFQVAAVTGVRNMMVDLLPARIGELVYVALLNRGYRVSASTCLSSLSIAIVFDFMALGSIIVIAVLVVSFSGKAVLWLWSTLVVVATVIAIAVTGLVWVIPLVSRWLARLPQTNRLTSRLAIFSRQFSDAIITSKNAGVLLQVFALSLAIRSFKYAGLFCLFIAVASPAFPLLANAGWEKILAALVGAEISASLPVPALMSFGTYEAGGSLTLGALGFSKADSLLALLGVHIWSQSIDYGIGLICFAVIILMSRRGATSPRPVGNHTRTIWLSRLKVALAVTVFLAGLAALALQYRSHGKLGATVAPPVGNDLRTDHRDQIQNGISAITDQNLNGFIVWSSNRFGNHDILRMALPSGEISQLTRHPHTETWPRISADGKHLVFARSREPWVSQRNAVAWDVILLNMTDGSEQRIAEFASYPFWVRDNVLGYLSQGRQIMTHDLRQGTHHPFFIPGQGNSMPPGAALTSPDIHPDQQQAVFTARQSEIGMQTGFWGTALWHSPNSLSGVLDGCELNWSSDGSVLYQIGHGGKQKTRIYRIDPQSLVAEPLLDLSGEFSHEYWPEDSNDGRYLVFGASRGDHEHDTADYEIFLWQIGRPESETIRLTFHSGNDNWPDIFVQ